MFENEDLELAGCWLPWDARNCVKRGSRILRGGDGEKPHGVRLFLWRVSCG